MTEQERTDPQVWRRVAEEYAAAIVYARDLGVSKADARERGRMVALGLYDAEVAEDAAQGAGGLGGGSGAHGAVSAASEPGRGDVR